MKPPSLGGLLFAEPGIVIFTFPVFLHLEDNAVKAFFHPADGHVDYGF